MEIVYENPWFKVEKHDKMHFVSENKKRNAAAVLVLLDDTHYVLVEVFRAAIGANCIEIPRGYGNGSESSQETAIREVMEETGFVICPENVVKLGSMNPNSGILASTIDLFLATASSESRLDSYDEDNEIRKVVLVKKIEIKDFIAKNNIADAFFLSAMCLANL